MMKMIQIETQIERFREIRKIIVNPLIKFKENLLGTNSAKEITKRLYEFLIENEIDRKLEEKRERAFKFK